MCHYYQKKKNLINFLRNKIETLCWFVIKNFLIKTCMMSLYIFIDNHNKLINMIKIYVVDELKIKL